MRCDGEVALTPTPTSYPHFIHHELAIAELCYLLSQLSFSSSSSSFMLLEKSQHDLLTNVLQEECGQTDCATSISFIMQL